MASKTSRAILAFPRNDAGEEEGLGMRELKPTRMPPTPALHVSAVKTALTHASPCR